MLLTILIALAAVIVVLVIVVALRPSAFRITRTATISAPAADVFAHVNDLHNWEAWSPWAKIDPAMKTTYSGAPAGTGAIYEWSGNNKVGEGSTTIVESRPSNLVRIQLEFVRPFACTNAVEFTFQPTGNQTVVTWSMTGRNNFIVKAFSLVMSMDRMVGGEFEKGLAQLKALTEAAAR